MTARNAARLCVAAVVAVAAVTAACSQTPTPEEARVAFCEDMLQFEGAVSDLAAMDPTETTVDQVKTEVADVGDALAEMRASRARLNADDVAAFDQAAGELRSELQGVTDVESLRAAAPSLRKAGTEAAAAFGNLFAGAGCDDPAG